MCISLENEYRVGAADARSRGRLLYFALFVFAKIHAVLTLRKNSTASEFPLPKSSKESVLSKSNPNATLTQP